MSRRKEVEENQRRFTKTMEEITKSNMEIEAITSLNLAAIAQMLADISETLAVIADNMPSDTKESEVK